MKDPKSREFATEGLAWTEVRAGDFAKAARYADQGVKEHPESWYWRLKRLEVLRLDPERRPEVSREYQTLINKNPKRVDAREQYAEWLSWSEDTRWKALSIYQNLIAEHPKDAGLKSKYAATLLDSGRKEEAARLFQKLIVERPEAANYLGLARSLHWLGYYISASEALSSGLARFPDDPGLLQERRELKSVYQGDASALFKVTGARGQAEGFHETSGYRRTTFGVAADWIHRTSDLGDFYFHGDQIHDGKARDFRKALGLHWTHQFSRAWSVTAEPSVSAFSRNRAFGNYDVSTTLRARAVDAKLSAGYRQALWMDSSADLESQPYMNTSGSGGAAMDLIHNGYRIHEAYFNAGIGSSYGYVWGSGQAGTTSDWNHRGILASGVALSALRLLRIDTPHILYLTASGFTVRFTRQTPRYFSPPHFSGFFPGGSLLLFPSDRFTLRGEIAQGFLRNRPNDYKALSFGGSATFKASSNVDFYVRANKSQDLFYRVIEVTGAGRWRF